GHGRNPASAYENAEVKVCPVCGQKAGDPCTLCGKGSLRPMAAEIVIRIKGSAPVTADQYTIERLRCDTCGEIFKGKLPEEAGEAELLFIDDTWSLVLEASKKQFTTGVVARVENHWMTLYLTGADAAGKKVLELLIAERPTQLPPPLQMSDALSSNYPDPVQVIVLLCWVHARRQFFEIQDFYPQECAPVLEAMRLLYKHEAEIQRSGLDDPVRLNYHQ